MSYYVPLKSACGRKTAMVDMYDVELNPNGVICCGECETIIESRNSWESLWQDFIDRTFSTNVSML